MTMYQLLFVGVWAGRGCIDCTYLLSPTGLKAARSRAWVREGLAPSSSHRQRSCPHARELVAGCHASLVGSLVLM